MSCHSCYRVFAGVDILMCLFSMSAWILVYFRAEDLIHLQFASYNKTANFTAYIKKHKESLRSVGNNGSPQITGEMLRDIYDAVQIACQDYYTKYRIDPREPNLEKELIRKLLLEVLLVIIANGAVILFDCIMVLTTRHSKTGHKNIALANFILVMIFSAVLVGGGMAYIYDPAFCASSSTLIPLRGPMWIFLTLYKPFHLYVIFKYYRETATHPINLESESESSSSFSSMTPPPSPNTLTSITQAHGENEHYEFDKTKGIPGSNPKFQKSDGTDSKAALKVHRQINLTDIPGEHQEVHQRHMMQVGTGLRPTKLLGWGTGKNTRRSARKIHPSKSTDTNNNRRQVDKSTSLLG